MNAIRSASLLVPLAAFASLAAASPGVRADALDGDTPATEDAPLEESEPEPVTPPSDLDSRVRVLQQRPILKQHRFEFALTGGVSLADVMHVQHAVGANGRFHLSEDLAIGASYTQYLTRPSGVFDRVTGDLEVFPELSTLRWHAGLEAAFVMLDGKFKLFESGLGYWDLQAFVGGGVTSTSRSEALPTALVGVGLRLFLTRWLSLTFELRDHLYVESFNAGDRLVNNVVGQGGLTLFIPFGFDYTFPK
jgi:outer membrane beta-barrel protein